LTVARGHSPRAPAASFLAKSTNTDKSGRYVVSLSWPGRTLFREALREPAHEAEGHREAAPTNDEDGAGY
jgi:hypothetical protein